MNKVKNKLDFLVEQLQSLSKTKVILIENEITLNKTQKKRILERKILKARIEIRNLQLSRLCKQPNNNATSKEYKELINEIISNLKQDLPTFLKLFPKILEKINKDTLVPQIEWVNYNYKGEKANMITTPAIVPYLKPTVHDEVGVNSKRNLNNLLDKFNKEKYLESQI